MSQRDKLLKMIIGIPKFSNKEIEALSDKEAKNKLDNQFPPWYSVDDSDYDSDEEKDTPYQKRFKEGYELGKKYLPTWFSYDEDEDFTDYKKALADYPKYNIGVLLRMTTKQLKQTLIDELEKEETPEAPEAPISLVAQLPALRETVTSTPVESTSKPKKAELSQATITQYTQRVNKLKKDVGADIKDTEKMLNYIESLKVVPGTKRNYYSALLYFTKDTPEGEIYRKEVLKLKN